MSVQSIVFGTSEAVSADSYTFEIDGEQSVFASGATVNVNMYPSDISASLFVSSGTASFIKRGEVSEHTEYLVFANSDIAYTQFSVSRLISAVWQGVIGGTVSVKGTEVKLPASASGVLMVTYETKHDVISVKCSQDTQCLLTAKGNNRYGYTVLDYTYNITGTVEVVLKVKDACSGVVLPDADVWLNGEYRGKTDSYGYINLGKLNNGTYSLKTVKSGYQSSDSDIISNDKFTVE